MKPKRSFHAEVRVVYRACRRLYGTEKTQDECLEIFKAVFPEQLRLEKSDEPAAFVPDDVRNNLYRITQKWHARGHLAEVIRKAETWFAMPFETSREELIQFYKDITPVAMRIRKLTPTETGRLMGLRDDEIQKMYDAGLSNSSMYKLHGNSIVVDVMVALFDKLFINKEQERIAGTQLTLF